MAWWPSPVGTATSIATIRLFLPGLESEDKTRGGELGATGLSVPQHCRSRPVTSFYCRRILMHGTSLEISGLDLSSHLLCCGFDLTCIYKMQLVYSVECVQPLAAS